MVSGHGLIHTGHKFFDKNPPEISSYGEKVEQNASLKISHLTTQ